MSKYKKTICIDLDGTIADYSKGFRGDDSIGSPLPGAKDFLQTLKDMGWIIIIFTARDTAITENYMRRNSLLFDYVNHNPLFSGLNKGKPSADIYLDDRGLYFNGNYADALEAIRNFKVWYKK